MGAALPDGLGSPLLGGVEGLDGADGDAEGLAVGAEPAADPVALHPVSSPAARAAVTSAPAATRRPVRGAAVSAETAVVPRLVRSWSVMPI